MEIPTAADSRALIGTEEVCKSREELSGSKEIGNLKPLQLFEFIQIATQLDTALSFILDTVLVKNLTLAWHRSTWRLPPKVFC